MKEHVGRGRELGRSGRGRRENKKKWTKRQVEGGREREGERGARAKSANWLPEMTLTWKMERPLIQATNLERVVLPAPLTPINSR